MDLEKIESCIIDRIENNLRDSGDKIPTIDSNTSVFNGIPGFDSLRTIEVLIDLEDVFKCELPPEKVFVKKPPGSENIRDVSLAVSRVIEENEQ